MGTLNGTFKRLDGSSILVSLTGNSITTGVIELSSTPVVLQMDAEDLPCGTTRYATASIGLLTDGVEPLEVYPQTILSTQVIISDLDTDKVLFAGYLTPNVLTQPLDGESDEVVLEAVDFVGAMKYIPYPAGEGGATAKSIIDVIITMLKKVGNVASIYLPTSISVVGENGSSVDWYKMAVSEGDMRDDDGNYNDCYTILSDLATSFSLSVVSHGAALYLLDVPSLGRNMMTYKRLATSNNWTNYTSTNVELNNFKVLDANDFAESGSTFSFLRRYSSVEVEGLSCDEIDLIPGLLDDDNLTGSSASWAYITYDDGYKLTELTSDLLETHVSYSGLRRAMVIAYAQAETDNIGNTWAAATWGTGKWTTSLLLKNNPTETGGATFLAAENKYKIPIVCRNGYGLRLQMTAEFSGDTDKLVPCNAKSSEDCHLLLSVKIGGYYYNEVSDTWSTQFHLVDVVFPAAGTTKRTQWRLSNTTRDYPLYEYPFVSLANYPSIGGELSISIYINRAVSYYWYSCWLSQLQVTLAPTYAAFISRAPRLLADTGKAVANTIAYDNALDKVTLPYSFSAAMGERQIGTKIDGTDYYNPAQSIYPYPYYVNLRYGSSVALPQAEAIARRIIDVMSIYGRYRANVNLFDKIGGGYLPPYALLSPGGNIGDVCYIAGYEWDLGNGTYNVDIEVIRKMR